LVQQDQNRKNISKCTKWPLNIPNGRTIDEISLNLKITSFIARHLKFTQIGIFGLKIYHLATLVSVCELSNDAPGIESAPGVVLQDNSPTVETRDSCFTTL
jgi:hypothetical protein